MSDAKSVVGGAIKVASKENFALVDKQDHDSVYMQFGKINDNLFSLQVQHPFSILQAFAMCLSAISKAK